MTAVLLEILHVLNESALYLLIGFALAGVMHVLFNRSERLSGLLSGRGPKSIALASLVGVPLPLCSCGVLPAALALRKKGAGRGATASFLISVPETDVISILLTYGLLGPLMAVARPVSALITAFSTGLVVDWAAPVADTNAGEAEDSGCQSGCEAGEPRGALREALHFGFVEFFDDIIVSLLIGILLGGVIGALLPSVDIANLPGGAILQMLVMAALGIPIYVCATSSTPMVAGLLLSGVDPGAALVFLLVGPATNMASLFVLARRMGRRFVIPYVATIAVVSLLMGIALDAIIEIWGGGPAPVAASASQEHGGPWKIAASILFLALAAAGLYRRWFSKRSMTEEQTEQG